MNYGRHNNNIDESMISEIPHACQPFKEDSEYEIFEKELKKGLEDHDIKKPEDLLEEVKERKNIIAELERSEKKKNQALKRKLSLEDLERFVFIYEKMQQIKSEETSNLIKEINETLERHDIKKLEDLPQEIEQRKTQIKPNSKSKRTHERKASLKELEDLQCKAEQAELLKPSLNGDELNNRMLEPLEGESNQSSKGRETSEPPQQVDVMTADELKSMYSDYSDMPICSERAIIALIYYASLQTINDQKVLDSCIKIEERSEQEIEEEFLFLENRLRLEELDSAETLKIVDQSRVLAKNRDLTAASKLLRRVLKELRPLNVPEILRLVEKANSTADLVKDQNIVLFLGDTGSGKSTTIHYLSGSKMIETTVNGMPHIGFSEVKNPDLINIKTSPSGKSETRYISSVRVDPQDIGATFDDPVYLCDTPGFGDTAGSEVDMANGAGMIMAIRGCKSVKPVVLISYKSVGDRMTGLKKITHLLAAMIPEMKDYSKAFSFFFTKYPNRDKDGINASLRNIKAHLNEEEEADEGFKILINKMIQKTANKPAVTIDPLGGNPIAILDDLMESEPIKRPDEVFRFSLTEKSKADIQLYLQRQQSSILKAANRYDYALAVYKMNELRKLYQTLQHNTIDQVYTECVRDLSKKLDAEYNSGVSAISRGLALQNELTTEDVRRFSESIKAAERAEHLRKMHLSAEVVSSNAYMQALRKQVQDVVLAIEQREVDDLLVKTNLDKISLVVDSFAEFKPKYKHACQIVLAKISSSAEIFRTSVSHGEFKKSSEEIQKISHCITSLSMHLDQSAMQQKYDEAKTYLMDDIQASVQNVDHLFEHTALTKEDVEALGAYLLKIETVQGTPDLHPHVDLSAIQMVHDSLVQKIVSHFNSINTKINDCFARGKESSLPAIEALIDEMIRIRTIQEIEYKTAQSYHSTLEMLFGFVSDLGRDVEHILASITDNRDSINYSKLYKCLNGLKMAKWLESLRPTVYADLVRDVDERVLQHAFELESRFKAANFSLEDSDSLKTAYKIFRQLNMMTELQKVIPALTPIFIGANKLFTERTQSEFEVVRASLEKWPQRNFHSFDCRTAEGMLIYLRACKEIDLLSKEASALLSKLCDVIKDYSIFIQEQIKYHRKEIMNSSSSTRISLFNNSQELADLLRDVFQVKSTFLNVFSIFDPEDTLILKLKKSFRQDAANLSSDMEQFSVAQKNQLLNDKIVIAKGLSQLDEILGERLFNDLYVKYQDQFNKGVPDVLRQGNEAVSSHNYSTVFEKISELEELAVGKQLLAEVQANQLKKVLNDSVEQLIEETITMTKLALLKDNVTVDSFLPIAEKLRQIQNAETHVGKYLTNTQKIKDQILKIKDTLSGGILDQLKSIEGAINSRNFAEVDRKKRNVRFICETLGNYCEEKVFQEMKRLDVVQAKKLEALSSIYLDTKINDYFTNPPKDIYTKLEKVKDASSQYEDALNKIEESIVVEFRKELEKAKSNELTEVANPHLRNFKAALNYLPDHLKTVLNQELDYCIEDIRQKTMDHNGEVETTVQSQDPKRIRAVLEKSQKNGAHTSSRKIASSVMEIMQKDKLQADTFIEKGEISKVSSNLKRLFEYKKNLGDLAEETKQPYFEVRSRLLNQFKDVNSTIMNILSNTKTPVEATIEMMKRSFSTLLEFIALKEATKEHEVSSDIFQEDFLSKLEQIDKKFSAYFQHYQKEYEESLPKIDICTLNVVLTVMRNWSSFLNYTKDGSVSTITNNTTTNSIFSMLSQLKSYTEMSKAVSKKLTSLQDGLLNENLLNEETQGNEKQRDKFYEDLNSKLTTLMNANELANHVIDIDIPAIQQECTASFDKKLKDMASTASEILEKTPLLRSDADTFNVLYGNLASFSKLVKVCTSQSTKGMSTTETKVEAKVQELARKALDSSDISHMSDCLISMKTWSDYLFDFKPKIDQRIDEVLFSYRNKKNGANALARLGTLLNQDESGAGPSIVSEHKCFKGYNVSLFNTHINRHGLDYVKSNLSGDDIDKDLLEKRYKEFETCYKRLIKLYLRPKLNLAPLLSETHLAAGKVQQTQSQTAWDSEVRYRVPKLAAHIFALWTLMNSTHYFEAESLDNKDSYLLQPHAAQVISIFRILGIGDKKEELKNNLVQIGTGEGKSVTLAVAASIFALLGFDVDCACYSNYLSQRDYLAFQSMFDQLNVLNNINYGTFNKMCEGVINQYGDIRKVVADTILNASSNIAKVDRSKVRPKILLIDEVDVFFNKDFYGNVYTPASSLKDPVITALLDFIWKQKKSSVTLEQIKATPEFQACCQKFQIWTPLIEEAVKDMLFDIKSFESHSYIVSNDKIGYKEQDNIVFNAAYGYKTLFAYYAEHENGKISKESLENNKFIRIRCGGFSYAEIPHLFKFIMGVTGTLKTLSDPERKVIQDVYGIKKDTYCPSVFGKNNLKFSEKNDVTIENGNDYFNAIAREIEVRLEGKLEGTKRAVMVFFESEKTLNGFYVSHAAAKIKKKIIRITEEVTGQQKEALIRRATTSGQITLLTRCFGRGTDFVCHDQTVSSNGGLHVIQTFHSEEESEEVQIKGRTARQGAFGSYSLILLDSSLERFLITKENLEEIKKGKQGLLSLFKSTTEYDFLNKKRIDLFKAQYQENSKFLVQIKKRHDEALKFLSSLHDSRLEDVKDFLLSQNIGASSSSPSKTIIAMDATGSMVNLLHKSKNTVGTMFERAKQILLDNKLDKDSFQIQFVFYRNYNSLADKLLQISPWENKPENLRKFAETINAEGGWANEAIEVALWHANMEMRRRR